MPFEPTLESIRTHQVPDWFHDAKLGIFIHWGLYSIPAWAPTTGPLPEVVEQQGWEEWFRRNPYAEWYANSLRVPGSPTRDYHREQYGEGFSYDDFTAEFNQRTRDWEPGAWADLFAEVGAAYVVLTTKHHDGFLLWPSAHPNPTRPGLRAARDIVGDLTDAVRARGMRMGLYYSGGLDWTFNDRPITTITDLFLGVPQGADYVAYANAHLAELTERYKPSVLWNDIAYPANADLPAIFAAYYNQVAEGVINDRWVQGHMPEDPAEMLRLMTQEGGFQMPAPAHFDFRTPEYAVFADIKQEKWEACRGLGFSFGYNRNDSAESMLSPTELIHSFVDIVSKNGNLLLNVGPTGDGTIPENQVERLHALGAWLRVNGEAIFASRPWQRAEGQTNAGLPVRFTTRAGVLYAIVLGTPTGGQLTLRDLTAPTGARVALLGGAEDLSWLQQGGNLVVDLPALPDSPAHTLRIG